MLFNEATYAVTASPGNPRESRGTGSLGGEARRRVRPVPGRLERARELAGTAEHAEGRARRPAERIAQCRRKQVDHLRRDSRHGHVSTNMRACSLAAEGFCCTERDARRAGGSDLRSFNIRQLRGADSTDGRTVCSGPWKYRVSSGKKSGPTGWLTYVAEMEKSISLEDR